MYRFVSGKPSVKYLVQPLSLYNTEAHRLLQSSSQWYSFHILNTTTKKTAASFYVHLIDGLGTSPYKAPFGGIELHQSVKRKTVLDFIAYVEAKLKKIKTQRVVVKLPSRLVDETSLAEQGMLASGFQIEKSETASIIQVKNQFALGLHYSEKKRLNKSLRSGFVVQAIPITEIKKVYQFIHDCRLTKNFDLSMEWSAMQKLVKQFPSEILLFSVQHGKEMAAASICVRVNEQMIYDFYHDHSPKYNLYSPVVLLVKGIYDYCLENKISRIELGTSMIGDQVNAGLHKFKLRLGATAAVKNTLVKILS